MLGVVDLPTFVAGLVVMILLPGPNSLYVLATASRSGARPAYAASAGVWTGDAVLMILAVAGVASVLQAHPLLFTVIKFLGAGYLGWLGFGLLLSGIGAWRRHRGRGASELVDEIERVGGTAVTPAAAYRRALVVSLLNPKAILFFVSFFVQFVDPTYAHPWASFLVLGSMVTLTSFCYLSVLVLAGAHLSAVARRRQALTAGASTAAGALFMGFAVKLSLASAG
ncbi:leucine efflux protein LeuE [Nocardioides sp. Y6]|uniref:Leucine efflux protein LeuE n=1 Tax=Nocardioides malaquae TaxID=2773426 RepID=A0ABR9RWF5_9ACTN|nr:leucine efflux protein LeuE [Nocardioides malaquae]MBE7325700.1 leucine efflux protein LeuE [Nocardioides malaquae]